MKCTTVKVNIENRRYIGSKSKLSKWIIDNILNESKDCNSFFDVFSGTGIMAKIATDHYKHVIINDFLYSNEIIYKAFFYNGKWNKKKIDKIVNEWNNLNVQKIGDNYFSKHFGGKFFEKNIAKKIGFIREGIASNKDSLTEKEHAILLTTLIYSIDKIANTVGHFDAYIKKPIEQKTLHFNLINAMEYPDVRIFREDANILVKKVSADIAYVDPPYNSRQYSRFYHIYENLVTWEKPKLHGVALKPEPENMSDYCKISAEKVFGDLIENLDAKYIAVSYNNTYTSKSSSSENKIKLEEIKNILNQKGKTKTFEAPYRFFNAGKTDFKDHKEYLFITKVNGK